MARNKYKYVCIKPDVAVSGRKLAELSEKELREIYESGDVRHIVREEKETPKAE